MVRMFFDRLKFLVDQTDVWRGRELLISDIWPQPEQGRMNLTVWRQPVLHNILDRLDQWCDIRTRQPGTLGYVGHRLARLEKEFRNSDIDWTAGMTFPDLYFWLGREAELV